MVSFSFLRLSCPRGSDPNFMADLDLCCYEGLSTRHTDDDDNYGD